MALDELLISSALRGAQRAKVAQMYAKLSDTAIEPPRFSATQGVECEWTPTLL